VRRNQSRHQQFIVIAAAGAAPAFLLALAGIRWILAWEKFRRVRMIPLLVFLAILVVIGFIIAGMYNGLVQLKIRADNAWSDIDVQLKRRHDLVPNLVETVKGYASHEKTTFEDVARFRSAAMAATSAADRAQAEGQLTQALRGLLAVAEAYPELKANTQFQALQQSLSELEDALQNSRRYYNAVVRDLNTRIQSFPTNLIAGTFNFQQRQFFEISEPAERAVPNVNFQS
jgi:LemA protein